MRRYILLIMLLLGATALVLGGQERFPGERGRDQATVPGDVVVRAAGHGHPWIHLADGRALPARLPSGGRAERALKDGTAKALALAAADFDEDGVPDLAASFTDGARGFVTTHRGNVDAIHANTPEAKARRAAGTNVDAPFLPDTRSFDTTTPADFMAAGDFDADGHWDIVTAARGGSRLSFHAGDGAGGFAEHEPVSLPGAVTALVAGEVNRPDGLVDLVVGVEGPAGAAALVFEGSEGALRAAWERIDLPGPAVDIVVGFLLGGRWSDVVIATQGHLVSVRGRDRRSAYPDEDRSRVPGPLLETHESAFAIRAMAAGDFDGDQAPDFALLGSDGAVRFATPHALGAIESEVGLPSQRPPAGMTAIPAISPAGRREARLLRARVSGLPGDDLILLDRPGSRLHVRIPPLPKDGPKPPASAGERPDWIALESEGGPVAALPMRLNRDALSDLVVLSDGPAPLATLPTRVAMTFTVTNTNPSGTNSLSWAIDQADDNFGVDAIEFNIAGTGPHYIDTSAGLPNVSQAVTIDATTEPDYGGITPVVVLDGAGAAGSHGLIVTGGGTLVKGLAIKNWRNIGLALYTIGGNTVEANFIGTDEAGMLDAGNAFWGIDVSNSTFATIGGTIATERNVISGNDSTGVHLTMSGGAVIQGNYIGTDRTGTSAIPNRGNGGILIQDSDNVTVGGTTAGAGNVISGNNPEAIVIGGDSSGSIIQGNNIGTTPSGTVGLGNGTPGGIRSADTTSGSTVGGLTPGARNIISGNSGYGVGIGGTGDAILGNYIGVASNGTSDLGNADDGIQVRGADALIRDNLVSGNGAHGIFIFGAGNGRIVGNLIGTTWTGMAGLGNEVDGIDVFNSPGNRIGGPGDFLNVIAANGGNGVEMTGALSTGNLIEVNYIGTNATATSPLGNGMGIWIDVPGPNMIGVKLGQGNVISGNILWGVYVIRSIGVALQGNIIGLDGNGENIISNLLGGVIIQLGSGNVVGGATSGEGNVISGNGNVGVRISDSTLNQLQNNIIGLRAAGDTARPNAGQGVEIEAGLANLVGGPSAAVGNVISGNLGDGVLIHEDSSGNTVAGNTIGMDLSRTVARGNGGTGIEIGSASSNVIGGSTVAGGNLIAHNAAAGVSVVAGSANSIRFNSTHSNGGLGIDLAADGVTLNDTDDPDVGPNQRQNFPVIDDAVTTGLSLRVRGTLDALPGGTYTVDLYASSVCDATGQGEGRRWLGSTMTATGPTSADAVFYADLMVAVGADESITATATSSDGNTSEFSRCETVVTGGPGPVSGVAFSLVPAEAISWDPTPGAFLYHAYTGTRSTLAALATQEPDSCEAFNIDVTGGDIPPGSDPPLGQMLWILITAEGQYGEGPVQDGSLGPRQLTSTGPCNDSCAHDPCVTGAALTPACSIKGAIVCDQDPVCCNPVNGAWNTKCVQEVRSVALSLTCPESQGQCPHALCDTGAALPPGCDAPPLPASCTAEVCQADPHCCQQAWDDACIAQMAARCGYNCL